MNAELCTVIPNLCLGHSRALRSIGNQMDWADHRSSVSWSRYDDTVRWTIGPVVRLEEVRHWRSILCGAGTGRQTHGCTHRLEYALVVIGDCRPIAGLHLRTNHQRRRAAA